MIQRILWFERIIFYLVPVCQVIDPIFFKKCPFSYQEKSNSVSTSLSAGRMNSLQNCLFPKHVDWKDEYLKGPALERLLAVLATLKIKSVTIEISWTVVLHFRCLFMSFG